MLLPASIPSRTKPARKASLPQAVAQAARLPLGPVALQAEASEENPAGQARSTTFYSRALGREMPYLIYLPPGYESDADTRYPTIYMLHGLGGSYTEWYGYGALDAADRLIRAGDITPLIIVLPEGEQGYWVDHANGGPQWGTYVARDVVNEVDEHYRTIPDREHRAIGGMSMGGYGALELAMLNPQEFGVVDANAPTMHRFGEAPEYMGDQTYFAAHYPPSQIAADPARARGLALSLEIGRDDAWLGSVTALHQELLDLGVRHEWQVYAGGHTSESWAEHVEDDLRFYGAALHEQQSFVSAPPQ